MSTGLITFPTAPLTGNKFAQALNDLLPKQFADYRAMTPELRETLTESLWYQNATELFVVIAPAILGTKFLCETLPVYAPMIRKLHHLAVANGRMAADSPMRRTWRMIGHTPTTCINTNGQEVKIQPDDAICWAGICSEVFQTSPSYVNKLTAEVPLLPPLPEEAKEKEGEEGSEGDAANTGGADGAEHRNNRSEGATGGSAGKRAARKKHRTAKGAASAAKEPETDPSKTTVLIPVPELKTGDVEALYEFLCGNGASGVAPIDAVFGGLEEGEFRSKLSRFSNRIAYAFFPHKMNVRVERVGEESKSSMYQLNARVVELEADLAQVRGQMHKMVAKANELRDPATVLEWINKQG
jgi:hypothetical protein